MYLDISAKLQTGTKKLFFPICSKKIKYIGKFFNVLKKFNISNKKMFCILNFFSIYWIFVTDLIFELITSCIVIFMFSNPFSLNFFSIHT